MFGLVKLRGEHACLIEIAQRLNAIIELGAPPPSAGIEALRRELATALIAHLQAEDWLLYPGLLNSHYPAIVDVARRFNAEMGSLSRTFIDYSERWMLKPAVSDWATFCRETRSITDALIERIERENKELYPLLELLERAA